MGTPPRKPSSEIVRDTGLEAGCPTLVFLGALDVVPQALDLGRRQVARGAEDVGVTPDQLGGDGLDHVAEPEHALLARHLGVKDDLEQQVAQFVAKVGEIATLDGIHHLIGFLDGVGRDRREGLFEVPRAAGARRAKRRHDLDEPGDVGGGRHDMLPLSRPS